MKILVNALSARLGGGQTYVLGLLRNIPPSDSLEILVLAPDALKLPADPRIRRLVPRWPVTNPLLRTLWERLRLPGVLRREQVDVLFCPGGVVASGRPPGCRLAVTFQNMMPFDPQVRRSLRFSVQGVRNALLYHVLLRSLSSADLSIFISQHGRRVIESRVRVPNPVIVPNGISDEFRTARRPLPAPALAAAGSYIVYVSRFDVYKHHDEVLLAYASLPADLRARHRLLLVGEVGARDLRRAQGLIADLCIADRVTLAGPLPHTALPALYQHAALILFASSCENSPYILLEAMGSGRPVASSDVDPMPEFAGDAVAYFSPFDPDDIAAAMQRVLCDEAFASALGARAAARSERYDASEAARQTWRHLLALARGEHAAASGTEDAVAADEGGQEA